ncbi:MAG: PorV/PorQ family protein [Flavobacteriales bacterium]|nr:PorV/PorQ family protein [Flavobacteriales bacterium]
MKKITHCLKIAVVSAVLLLPAKEGFSQEEAIRAGSAGASELLINPYGRSSGWGAANVAGVSGLEGQYSNVAGLASIEQTELIFSQTSWLQYGNELFNADQSVSSISTFGFSQKVGESGVMGIGVMSMNFGDIEITTVDMPDGGIGTFSPKFMNIGASYAHVFSNSIQGGATVRMISEQISDVSANGVAFDAGIQYRTGDQDELKFGIAFKNWGPKMSFSGDGLSFRGIVGSSDDYKMTVEQRSSYFDLPALFSIGISYDILLSDNRVTCAGAFTSNSFQKDQYRIGTEYSYKEYFMVRAGYVYEEGIGDIETTSTALTGPTAGFTVELPMGNGSTFGVDYSYTDTDPFKGSHAIGCRINL